MTFLAWKIPFLNSMTSRLHGNSDNTSIHNPAHTLILYIHNTQQTNKYNVVTPSRAQTITVTQTPQDTLNRKKCINTRMDEHSMTYYCIKHILREA